MRFQRELQATGELPIVELFNRDRWPGKREEFFTGNYGAIQMARDAGYDLALVGYLQNIQNDQDMVLSTKLIDVTSGVTIWSAQTTSSSNKRQYNDALSFMGIVKKRADIFDFQALSDSLAVCTVERMVYGEQGKPKLN